MLYAGAAVTAVFVGDLISLFIAWELTAIASVFQVLAPRSPESVRAAVRYLVFQISSGMLVLAGICMYVSATGDTQFALIAPSLTGLPVGVMDINAPGAVLILAGFGIKAAFPMVHNWLQDAYPRASETGSVVLSAFTTKLAVYALARYFAGLDWLIWIGAIDDRVPGLLRGDRERPAEGAVLQPQQPGRLHGVRCRHRHAAGGQWRGGACVRAHHVQGAAVHEHGRGALSDRHDEGERAGRAASHDAVDDAVSVLSARRRFRRCRCSRASSRSRW